MNASHTPPLNPVECEKLFIEKIKAEAEAEHVTVTEVINRVIRHYYAGS